MKRSREFIVGLFVAAGIVLFAFFVFNLKRFTGPSRTVTVEFGNVDGLGAGSPVQYAGYRVGQVESVKIEAGAGTPVKLLTTIRVPKDLPITTASGVSIASTGFMGDKVIEILPASGGTPLAEGAVLRGTDPVQLSQIFDQVRTMFDERTSGNIRQVTHNIVKLTEDLNVFTSTLRRIGAENGDDIDRILTNLSAGTDHFPGMMKSGEAAVRRIEESSKSLAALADHLKGMSAENRPEIQEIVKNLNATSENLKALSSDVRRHPWKLIRKGGGETEKDKRGKSAMK